MEHYLVLRGRQMYQMTDEEFYRFCQDNRDLRIERNEHQEIIIMSPTGSLSGYLNNIISSQLYLWNQTAKLGKTFDSSTGFKLPDGSNRSPDAAWVSNKAWDQLSETEKRKFAPLCPEFVIELKSDTDDIEDLKKKMQMWLTNGCRLAWLIDPDEEKAYVYRPDRAVELAEGFDRTLSGEDVLPDFSLDLSLLNS
ncbi:MAG: Uma2 family endonuclease [Bacteroidota bacterium]